MTTRVASVAAALQTTLIAASTTAGFRVYIGHLRPLQESRSPLPNPATPLTHLDIVVGPVQPIGGEGQTLYQHIDWVATYYVDIYVRATQSTWFAATQALWAEVHAALMADHTQALAYVIDTDPDGIKEPDVVLNDQVHVSLRSTWQIHIRTSVASLES